MKNLLAIKSSINPDGGESGRLVDYFIDRYLKSNPGSIAEVLDLYSEEIPELGPGNISQFLTDDPKSTSTKEMLDLSEAYIESVRKAEEIVIGMPFYNMAAPSAFKKYIDLLLRANKTFRFTEGGQKGLLEDRPVTVLCARGGKFINDSATADSQSIWLKELYSFIGIKDVRFIYAEGLSMGEVVRDKAINDAKKNISSLLAE